MYVSVEPAQTELFPANEGFEGFDEKTTIVTEFELPVPLLHVSLDVSTTSITSPFAGLRVYL